MAEIFKREVFQMVAISACDSYHDSNNNEIIGNTRNCKVIFKGKNSKLIFGGQFKSYGEGCVIILENNCEVKIGDSFQIGSKSVLFFRSNSKCVIDSHASIGNYCHLYVKGIVLIGEYFCMREYSELRIHGKLSMGDWVYLHHHVTIYVPKHTEMKCGSDVGFSWYSMVLSGSGHSTFDLKHKFKLEELCKNDKRVIEIGDHVWIGSGSVIGNDVSIGKESIISSGSIIESGAFQERSIISGYPAKCIATDVTWDRRPDLKYNEFMNYISENSYFIERPSFFDEYYDEDILEDYYKKEEKNEF